MNTRRLTISVLCVAACGVLFWIGIKNIVPSGRLYLTKDFSHPSRHITDLRPGERYELHTEENDTFLRMRSSPLFFHVRTPVRFERVVITVQYRNMEGLPFAIGAQTGRELYEFDYRLVHNPKHTVFVNARETFDAGRLRYDAKERRYQFSIMSNELLNHPDKWIDIIQIRLEFEKEPFALRTLWRKF